MTTLFPRSARMAGAMALAVLSGASWAPAHVDWTQVNQPDPQTLALFHFDEHHHDLFVNEEGLAPSFDLHVSAPSGEEFGFEHKDLPDAIFAPHAIHFRSAQRAESSAEAAGVDGDLTIEFWFQWDPALTTQRIEVGFAESLRLVIARDASNPANDLFGVAGAEPHGDFRSAPGFVDWPTVGSEEASLGEWRHVAVAIHSTGLVHDMGLDHDVYAAGSRGRFYLNGHLTGVSETVLDIEGMRGHEHSTLVIDNKEGLFYIDEATFWTKDWSDNGAVGFPFGDGRGAGAPPATPWTELNGVGPDTLGLYHFNSDNQIVFTVANGISPDNSLDVAAPAGDDFVYETDNLPGLIFGPRAVHFRSAQAAESIGEVESDTNATVEYWVRWDAALAAPSEFQAGFRSAGKLLVERDPSNPANDRFGLNFVHGDFVPAPGFTDWAALGAEAPLGAWLHVAATIQSTGMEFDETLAHDVYLPGSTARFWINGQEISGTRQAVDLTGIQAHDHSKLRVQNIEGDIFVDEVTMWGRDWSEDGTVADAFLNGRTAGPTSVENWLSYE
jgi:hypothetical protein